jgi:hypothetical protein
MDTTIRRVVIVRENILRASILLKHLHIWDCQVQIADNCATFLSVFKQDCFGLVLSRLFLAGGTADRFLRLLHGTYTHMFFSNCLEGDACGCTSWTEAKIVGGNRL